MAVDSEVVLAVFKVVGAAGAAVASVVNGYRAVQSFLAARKSPRKMTAKQLYLRKLRRLKSG